MYKISNCKYWKEVNVILIKCNECQLQVSDKAISCPHCGCPLQPNISLKKTRKSNRRRRLPNGFGQITEIKNRNLRNPFRAMVTVGKTETGRPICELLKPVAYFHTYNEAYAALIEYNKNPYDIDNSITLEELYDRWSKEYFSSLNSYSSVRNVTTAWGYCSAIYDMKAADVRVRHIKGCMEEGTRIIYGKERHASANTKSRIKSMFNLMLDYAVEYEIIDRNYARSFNVSDDISRETSTTKKEHIPFTDEEMEILWEHVDDVYYADVVLIQCYSGWRPQELGLIKLENVDLENRIFNGGMKTAAGTNRTVPIHSKIHHLVEQKYKEAESLGSKFLFNATDNTSKGLKLTYKKYQWRFNKVRDELKLNPDHRAHDPRKQFVTMAKKYNVDEYAIKYIVGHAINDITEKVYTNREIDWLKSEIEKIK